MWTSPREHTQMAESDELEGAQSEVASSLGPIEQTPLRVQVAERLRSAIVTGKLRPGAALVETALADIPALALTDQEARKLKHGQAIPVLPIASRSHFKNVNQGDTVCAVAGGKLVALATIKGGEVRPLRVMNL